LRQVAEDYRVQGKPLPKKIGGSHQRNGKTLTVDVTLEIGN